MMEACLHFWYMNRGCCGMKIKIIHNKIDDELGYLDGDVETFVEVKSLNEPFDKLRKKIGIREYAADLSFYYPYAELKPCETAPYVLINGNYKWDASFSEFTISDFIETHGINIEDGIQIRFIGIGGFGDIFINQFEKWAVLTLLILPYIRDLRQARQLIVGIYEMVNCREEDLPEFWNFVDLLLKKDSWNIEILSKETNMSKKHLASLLNFLGYVDKSGLLVIKESSKENLINRRHLDIGTCWGDEQLAKINANIIMLKCLSAEYNKKYNEKKLNEMVDSLINSSFFFKKGKGLRVIKCVRMPAFMKNKVYERNDDKIDALYQFARREFEKLNNCCAR